jgi:hypothetical protein
MANNPQPLMADIHKKIDVVTSLMSARLIKECE